MAQQLAGVKASRIDVAGSPVDVARLRELWRRERDGLHRILAGEVERALHHWPCPCGVRRVLAQLHLDGHLAGIGRGDSLRPHEERQLALAERDSAAALEIDHFGDVAVGHEHLRKLRHDLGACNERQEGQPAQRWI